MMRWTLLFSAALLGLCASSASAQLRIAILGDSMASGEGNPDMAGEGCVPTPARGRATALPVPPPPGAPVANGPPELVRVARCQRVPVWQGRAGRHSNEDRMCHRSMRAGPLLAAERLRDDLGSREAVTVETYACSGATTGDLRRPYIPTFARTEGFRNFQIGGQLGQLAADPQFRDPDTGDRIDALIIVIGANDIQFGAIAATCGLNPRDLCYRIRDVQPKIDELAARYDSLGNAIDIQLDKRVGAVFIVEYYNPSVGSRGYCGATSELPLSGNPNQSPDMQDLPFFWGMSWYESRWVTETLLPGLNRAVEAGARRNGWTYVSGAAERFRGHGYCDDDRWALNLTDTLRATGQTSGVVHPNRRGHEEIRDLVRAALEPYAQPLAAPASIGFAERGDGDLRLLWSGGVAPRRQVAMLAVTEARPGMMPTQVPPGFPGDGARQRVAVASNGVPISLDAPTGAADQTAWALAEYSENADGARTDASRHFIAAVRSCNALRCSGWSPTAITPASRPGPVHLTRGAGGAFVANWTGHARNGFYQIAIPTGPLSWNVFDAPLTETGPLSADVPPSPRRYTEPAGAPPSGQVRAAGAPPAAVTRAPPVELPQVFELYVRGCNQVGCSDWSSAAGFINPLRPPAPGAFRDGRSPCSVPANCGASFRRLSDWPEVPLAGLYQMVAFRRGGGLDPPQMSATPAFELDQRIHTGFRARACNLGGCSAWSAAAMLDNAPPGPTPAGVQAPPVRDTRAVPVRHPPRRLPAP